jgi:hypothetical protein
MKIMMTVLPVLPIDPWRRPWKECRLSDDLPCRAGSPKHPWRTAENCDVTKMDGQLSVWKVANIWRVQICPDDFTINIGPIRESMGIQHDLTLKKIEFMMKSWWSKHEENVGNIESISWFNRLTINLGGTHRDLTFHQKICIFGESMVKMWEIHSNSTWPARSRQSFKVWDKSTVSFKRPWIQTKWSNFSDL